MPFWRTEASKARHRQQLQATCYFCNSFQLASGSTLSPVHRFFCNSCGSYNALDVSGQPVSDERPPVHWDPSVPSNAQSFHKRASAGAAAASSSSLAPSTAATTDDSLYCRSCRTNQNLRLHLLASYYDAAPEDSAEDQHLQEHLQEYQQSLEARYPLLCEACAPKVEHELALRNARAKAAILNQAVIRSSPRKAQNRRTGRDPRARWRWKAQLWVWVLKGGLWAALQLGVLALCLYGELHSLPLLFKHPQLMLATGALHPNDLLHFAAPISTAIMLASTAASFFISFWQPLWAHHRHLQASTPDPRQVVIRGKSAWLGACALAFTLRFVLISGIVRSASSSSSSVHIVSVMCGLGTLTALLGAGFRLRVQQLRPVQTRWQRPLEVSATASPSPRKSSSASPPRNNTDKVDEHQPHPLFGNWRARQHDADSSSAAPMDIDDPSAGVASSKLLSNGAAGANRTELEDLLAGADLQSFVPLRDREIDQRSNGLWRLFKP